MRRDLEGILLSDNSPKNFDKKELEQLKLAVKYLSYHCETLVKSLASCKESLNKVTKENDYNKLRAEQAKKSLKIISGEVYCALKQTDIENVSIKQALESIFRTIKAWETVSAYRDETCMAKAD